MIGRRRRISLSFLVLCALVLAACSRVPPGGEVAIGGSASDAPGVAAGDRAGDPGAGFGVTTAPGADEATDAGSATSPGSSSTSAPGSSSTGSSPGGSASTGGEGGTATTGGSGEDAGATSSGSGEEAGATPAGSGPGIDGRTIEVVFHAQQSDCPNNPATAPNPGESQYQKMRNYINEYVKFYNADVFGPAGWQLEHQIVDDGGVFCPERQRAAALQIAKEIQPFAVLGFSQSAQGPIVADTVTRAGILHIGTSWQVQADERARHPYAWNVYPIAEKGLVNLVDWIEKRVKGTPFERSTPPAERVYGLVGLDNDEGRVLAQQTKRHLEAAGITVANTYLISPDAGVVAQQGTTIVTQMRQDGINTLVFGLAYSGIVSTVALSNQMDAQNFLPDVLVGTYGLAFFDQLHSKRVWANMKGVSSACVVCLRVEVGSDGEIPEKYDELAENDNAYIDVWQNRLGHGGPPEGQAVGPFMQIGLLATGVLHAGDTLNAQSFAGSLETAKAAGAPNRCTTARFVGRDWKHVPSFEWDAEHDGGTDDFTTIYWVNKQTTFNTNGYYESYDNYVFVDSMDHLPKEPSHDTGEKGEDITAQEPHIGIEAWTPCSQFPNYPG